MNSSLLEKEKRLSEKKELRLPDKQTYQGLDYTYTKQALGEIPDLLPLRCKKADKIREVFKEAL